MREYRKLLVEAGQASPPRLAKLVNRILNKELGDKSLSVLDVGCGLGSQMSRLVSLSNDRYAHKTGLDWSPATVQMHATSNIYDDIQLADSAYLPFKDKQFDLSISMENLEHLYGDACIESIKEMARVSKYVVISTPLPQSVINFHFLKDELLAAILDELPLSQHDYICLESAIHKSTLFPNSLVAAGFKRLKTNHGVYFGDSSNIDFGKIISVGIDVDEVKIESLSPDELKERYVGLLIKSALLHEVILKHEDFSHFKSKLSELDFKHLISLCIPPILRIIKNKMIGSKA